QFGLPQSDIALGGSVSIFNGGLQLSQLRFRRRQAGLFLITLTLDLILLDSGQQHSAMYRAALVGSQFHELACGFERDLDFRQLDISRNADGLDGVATRPAGPYGSGRAENE